MLSCKVDVVFLRDMWKQSQNPPTSLSFLKFVQVEFHVRVEFDKRYPYGCVKKFPIMFIQQLCFLQQYTGWPKKKYTSFGGFRGNTGVCKTAKQTYLWIPNEKSDYFGPMLPVDKSLIENIVSYHNQYFEGSPNIYCSTQP